MHLVYSETILNVAGFIIRMVSDKRSPRNGKVYVFYELVGAYKCQPLSQKGNLGVCHCRPLFALNYHVGLSQSSRNMTSNMYSV